MPRSFLRQVLRLSPLLAVALMLPREGPGAQALTGDSVVTRMWSAWHQRFFRTMTFVQETSFPGRPSQTWYESMRVPGALRIDVAPLDSGRAMLFLGDSSHIFRRQARVGSRAGANEMLTVFADIYVQPVTVTRSALRSMGIDMAKVHARSWNGDSVLVVGATAGDTTVSQFWVRTRDWRTVRVRIADGAAPGLDAQVERFETFDGVPVETQLALYRGGTLVQRETYSDVRLNVPLDPAIFDPTRFVRPAWIPR